MKKFMVMAAAAVAIVAMAHEASAQGYGRRMNGGHRHGGFGGKPFVVENSTHFDGFNEFGGVNTRGFTTLNTAHDPYRNISRHVGPSRPVNRPVYDDFGRVVGYEQGREWQNVMTGQWHGERRRVTLNEFGGVERRDIAYGKAEE